MPDSSSSTVEADRIEISCLNNIKNAGPKEKKARPRFHNQLMSKTWETVGIVDTHYTNVIHHCHQGFVSRLRVSKSQFRQILIDAQTDLVTIMHHAYVHAGPTRTLRLFHFVFFSSLCLIELIQVCMRASLWDISENLRSRIVSDKFNQMS